MADEWYYSRDKKQHGPVTREELGDFAAAGDLLPGDLVWKDGMAEWVAASRVRGLIPQSPSAPPAQRSQPAPAIPRSPDAGGVAWHIVAIVAASLLALAFVLPWWSYGLSSSEGNLKANRQPEGLERFGDVLIESTDWVVSYKGLKTDLKPRGNGSISIRIWGWHTIPGVLGLIAGLVAITTSVVALAIRPLRRWAWIAYFVDAVVSLAVTVFALVFILSCPNDTAGFLSVGFSVGPFVSVLGAVTLLVAGLTGGITGLIRFLKSLKPSAN